MGRSAFADAHDEGGIAGGVIETVAGGIQRVFEHAGGRGDIQILVPKAAEIAEGTEERRAGGWAD